ncbi:MAG: LOG family protein [Candidatus Liptonbacteria bacterium]|nr:LOG family protein [Candidatus Liptonbacteria bacterium]
MAQTKSLPRHSHSKSVLKYKICVSGAAATGHCSPDANEKAELLGRLIAEHGMVLVTGATTGIPYWAAKGAKEADGTVIGFSPASSKAAHLRTYHLPTDYHDVIVYTGFDYAGRNLLLTRSSDAIITICGRMGTLNEFTVGYEDKKPLGVLLKTGGMADMLSGIIDKSYRGSSNVIFDENPARLLDKIIKMVQEDYKE